MELRGKAKESLIAAPTPRQSKQCLHDLQVKIWTMVLADVPFLPLPSSSGPPPQVVHVHAYCKMRNESKHILTSRLETVSANTHFPVLRVTDVPCNNTKWQLPRPMIWVNLRQLVNMLLLTRPQSWQGHLQASADHSL